MQLQSDRSLLCEHPAPVLQPLAGKSVRGLVHYGSVFRSGGGQQLEPPRVALGFEGMLHLAQLVLSATALLAPARPQLGLGLEKKMAETNPPISAREWGVGFGSVGRVACFAYEAAS